MNKYDIDDVVMHSIDGERFYGTIMKIEINRQGISYFVRFSPSQGRSQEQWKLLGETEISKVLIDHQL